MHKALKKSFIEEVCALAGMEQVVGVALSSGVDSTCVLFALAELGIMARAYSFRVEGVESQDWRCARATAEVVGVEFIDCVIPARVDRKIVLELIRNYGKWRKTDIECIYPFYFLFPEVRERILLTGFEADGHFCVSKRGMIHFRRPLTKLQEFRREYFKKMSAQTDTLARVARERWGKIVETPYNKKPIFDYLYSLEWDEVNKPKQKQVLRDLFPDLFAKVRVYPHTNLQCGDSQIRELFEPLLEDQSLNTLGRSRMVDLYRDIAKKSNGSHK